jgi:hypothetical protein
MMIVPLLADEVENNVDFGEEFELNDDNRYEREKAEITEKARAHLEHKIARRIAKREIVEKRIFARRTRKIQRRLNRIHSIIDGLRKRVHIYSKSRKDLKIRALKLRSQKKNAILKIKAFRNKMHARLVRREIRALRRGAPLDPAKRKAILKLQRIRSRKIIRRFLLKERLIKRQLRHLSSKKAALRRKIAHLKGIAHTYRAKLAIILKKKDFFLRRMQKRRSIMYLKALRHLKVYTLLFQIRKHLKHVEQRLGVTINPETRAKLVKSRQILLRRERLLKRRVAILRRRKAQRKMRKIQIRKVRLQLRKYHKQFRAEKKMKVAQLLAAKRQVVIMKRIYKKAERAFNNAKSLKRRERKATALKGARLAYFATKTRIYRLKKDIRDMKSISIQKVHAIVRSLLKLKLLDAKMRIAEHKVSIKEYEDYKKKVVLRIQQLKRFAKRLDLCPANQRLLRRRLYINGKRLKHVGRKIAHSLKAIRNQQTRIGFIHRKFRLLAIKEYKHMKRTVASLKQSLRELRMTVRAARFKKACSGVITRRRMSFIIKKAKNEMRSLRLELNDLRLKIKAVDDAIAEEKRQRLHVTKIDYHRSKAALYDAKHAMRVLSRKIQKNKELATSSVEVYKKRMYFARNAKLIHRLSKLDAIVKRLQNKVATLKVRYNKLRTAEVAAFLAKKSKWESRKALVIAKLNKLAKRDQKITRRLRRGICRIKKCRLMFGKKYNFLQAHKLQLILFKINAKLEKIHAEYVRRSEAKSFRIIRKRFLKQQKKYVKNEKFIKHTRHQLTRIEKKIAVAEQRLPYLPENQKVVAKGVLVALEKIKKTVIKKLNVLESRKTTVLKRYLDLNKEYLIQLKKRMASDTKRKTELTALRPTVLHEALYELIPRKQQKAERRLNNLDKELEALDKRVIEDKHNLEQAIRTRKFLVDAVKPKVECTGGVVKCRYCHILGRIVKTSLRKREEDRVILERLHHRCNKETPNNQAVCLEVAMRLTEVAVNTFDPLKFRTVAACKKIGVCGI